VLERFDQYMERCLYDPANGFYASGAGVAGRRRGDFITSPEVGPLFADVLANALDHWWDQLGRPTIYPVFDAGTGPGTLTRALDAAPGRSAEARRVFGLDRGRDPEPELPDDLTGAVVVANELLDNLPFRIVERTPMGWSEVWVVTGDQPFADQAGRPVERLEPVEGDLPAVLGTGGAESLAPGTRLPILTEAGNWVADVLDRRPAALVVFDYGAATSSELARRGGWLRTYRQHQRSDDPYREPGAWDITTDVPVDQLPEPAELTDQESFLKRWGIDQLVAEGKEYWRQNAAAPDLAALRMRSRVAEAEALLDPAGLGGWLVCTWSSVESG
jgi:SAM-dependent MidA family methyltransferase